MKKLIFMSLLALLASCGGTEKKGTAFNPKENESELTTAERQAAIAAKKNSLNVNVDLILSLEGVKFSVLPPEVNANLSEQACARLTSKIVNIAAENGVGGFCTNPVLGLISKVDCIENGLTGTAPQKAIAKYEITLYCGNFITNDIYASTSVSVTGVGNTFDLAAASAFNELTNTSKIQEMFKRANENALKWYSEVSNVSSVVDQAVAKQDYALAMAILSSVPVQTKETYDYAQKKNPEVCNLFFEEKADELLAKMEGAIDAANGEYNPEVGAYLSLIPARSKAYAQANELYAQYSKGLEEKRKDEVNRQRSVEDQERANAQALEMEKLAVEKIKAPYEAEATIAQIKADEKIGVAQARAEGKKNANTGGFLGMGKLWDGAFGIANRIMDNFD